MMRRAWQRFNLAVSVVLTVSTLFLAVTRGWLAGYLLALVGLVMVAAALISLKRPRRE